MDYIKILDLRKSISKRMEELVNSDFKLNIASLTEIHDTLFKGIYFNHGGFRRFDLYKEELLLYGDSVHYANYNMIPAYLGYIIRDEKNKDYSKMTNDEVAKSIATFTKDIWQVHPFNDGNTRTTEIYVIKYLKSMGYNVDNEEFKNNAAYLRNALVKACYSNRELEIEADMKPLIKFYKYVLFDKSLVLEEEDLFIPNIYKIYENKTRRKNRKERK